MAQRDSIYGWTFASGWAAALEAQMLPVSFFEQMVDMVEVDDVFYSLTDTAVRDEFGHAEQMLEADVKVRAFYGRRLDKLRVVSPSPHAVDMLEMQQELRSLKSFVKRRVMDLQVPPVPSRYGDEVWESLWEGRPADAPPHFLAVLDRAKEALASWEGHPEMLEAACDSACLRALCEAAELTGCGLIADYYRRYDTVKGVEMLWRARMMGLGEEVQNLLAEGRQDEALFAALNGTEEQDWPALLAAAMPGLQADSFAAAEGLEQIQLFTAASDAWLMAFAREAKYVTFGPERVFGCAVGLMAEADNLVLAAGGRAHGVAPEVLRPRLRASYV